MAICAINMTVENRRDFGAMAMLLHVALIGAGAALIYCFFVMRSLLMDQLHGLLQQHFSSVYVYSLLVVGVVMIFVHGYGVTMCLRVGNWKKLYHKAFQWKVMMYLFLVVSFVMMLSLMTVIILTTHQHDLAIMAGRDAMIEAMKSYRTNINIKIAVDRAQLKNECCGAVSYLEWFGVQWIDPAYVPRHAPAKAIKYSFPFSCCNRHSERPCIDVDVGNADAHYKYNPSTDVTVYRTGCDKGVTRQLREVVFSSLRFYGWITVVIQTSTDVALTWADPTLICPGYLFNLGVPAMPLSKTSNIEEFRRQQERLEETVAMEADMNIKDDEEDEEQVSRWHKSKKKKENRTTNNWNSNEEHGDEVIYANTGYSSNNNSVTSADNSDNDTVMLLMPSARRQSRLVQTGFRGPTNITMSNRNAGQSAASSRRGSVSGDQPAPQQQEEEVEDFEEDLDEVEDDDEGGAGVAELDWENELQGRSSRRSITSVAGKPPLPPSSQRILNGGDVAADPITQKIDAGADALASPVVREVLVARRQSRVPVADAAANLLATTAAVVGNAAVLPYNQPSDTDDANEPFEDFDDEEIDMAGEGEWNEGAVGGEGEEDEMTPRDDKDKQHGDEKGKTRDRKKDRDRKDDKDKKRSDRKRSRSRKDGQRRRDKSRSRDRKRDKDRKGRKSSKDTTGKKERKRDGSKKEGRGKKSDRKDGKEKRKGRDRTRSKDKKRGGDKKGSKDKKGRDKEKKRDKRSKSRDKKREKSKDRKKKGGRSSGGRKEKKKDRKSKDKKRGGRSAGGRKKSGGKTGASGGKKSAGGRSPGGKSTSAKIKKGVKKLRRR